MSGGSSCSQTPSRAIPTRRVALGDGVQLPPGDYSTTPGGTLFSTTPGGKARGRGPRRPPPGQEDTRGPPGSIARTCDGGGGAPRVPELDRTDEGLREGSGGSPPSGLPAFWG